MVFLLSFLFDKMEYTTDFIKTKESYNLELYQTTGTDQQLQEIIFCLCLFVIEYINFNCGLKRKRRRQLLEHNF
jgi:hypothetical protein